MMLKGGVSDSTQTNTPLPSVLLQRFYSLNSWMDTVKETTLNFELDDQKRNMAESSVSAARGLPALMSNVTQAKTCNSQGKETVKHFQTETAKYSDIIDN